MAFTIIISETDTSKTLQTRDCLCRSLREHRREDWCAAAGATTETTIHTGEVSLPSGETISSGQGAAYHLGSDSYPYTIIGWTKSGKTLFIQKAERTANGYQPVGGDVEIAKWTTRRADATYRVDGCGRLTVDGYQQHHDPQF